MEKTDEMRGDRMIINFNTNIRQYIWNSLTLVGNIKEVVYKDHAGNVMPVFHSSQVEEIESIWFNSEAGAKHNHKFGILILGEAIKGLIDQYGILKDQDIIKYLITCNNVLLESMQDSKKLYVRIQTLDKLQDLYMSKIEE